MVGVHAAFTCTDESLEAAAGLAEDLGVGVHIHVCEGVGDIDAPQRLEGLTRDDWLLSHCVHLPTDHTLQGHDPPQPDVEPEQRRRVRRSRPGSRNPVALGTDGIGGNVLESFRLAYVMQRSVDVTVGPDPAWWWLETGWDIMPEARNDEVVWSYDPMDPWHIAFTPGIRPLEDHDRRRSRVRRRQADQGRRRRSASQSRRASRPAPRPAVTPDRTDD